MNILTVNFRNVFTIGLMVYLASLILRIAEGVTHIDLNMDGSIDPLFGDIERSFNDGVKKARAKSG